MRNNTKQNSDFNFVHYFHNNENVLALVSTNCLVFQNMSWHSKKTCKYSPFVKKITEKDNTYFIRKLHMLS